MKKNLYITLSLIAIFLVQQLQAQPFYMVNPGSFHTPARYALPDTQTTLGHRIIVNSDGRSGTGYENLYGSGASDPSHTCTDVNYRQVNSPYGDSSYFIFKFSPPVYHVKAVLSGFGVQYFNWASPPYYLHDSLRMQVNGLVYPLTSANLTMNTSFCYTSRNNLSLPHYGGTANDSAYIDANGTLVTDTTLVSWAPAIDINSTTPIDSVKVILPKGNNPILVYSVFEHSFYFADTGTFINRPFIDTALCRGDSLYLHYTVYAPHYSANVFTAQISNASGSFSSPTNIGTLTSNVSGVIACKLPATVVAGTGYRVRIVSSAPVRTGEDNGVDIHIKEGPAGVTAAGNAPICVGGNLTLTATPGATGTFNYSWTGPATYTSTSQNPTITGVGTGNSGSYVVTATGAVGCQSKDTVTVAVVTIPATPTAGSNSPVCTDNSIDLTASSTTPGVGYEWTGPGGYTSLLQNPSINPAALSDAGVYTVKATASGCNSAAVSTTVVVNQTPATPAAGNNGPLCEGGKLILNANSTTPGTGYEWTGPDGFSSVAQNPVIEPVDMANEGTYTVKAVMNGCSSAEVTTDVDIVPGTPLGAYASPNDSICPGTYLTLVTVPPTTAPAQYQWFKNNNSVSGATGLRYSTFDYSDGDTFYVRMYSTSMCSTPVTLYSNKIGITEVNMPMPLSAKVKSTPSPALPGGAVSFDLDLLNEGQNPTFQWQKNGRDVGNATFRVWSTSGLAPYDKVNCIVGSSDPCAEPKIKSSDTVEVNFATGAANREGNDGVMLYPNPNDGSFRLKIQNAKLKSLEVVNVAGQVVYQNNLAVLQSELIIDLPANVAPGLYQLRLHTNKGNSIMKFTVVK